MLVLLTPDLFEAWLTGLAGADVLRPAAESALRQWIVTTRLNRTGQDDDDPTLVEQAA